MPQMSPMLWLILYIYFLFMMLMFMMLMYYMLIYINMKFNTLMMKNKNMFFNKW